MSNQTATILELPPEFVTGRVLRPPTAASTAYGDPDKWCPDCDGTGIAADFDGSVSGYVGTLMLCGCLGLDIVYH